MKLFTGVNGFDDFCNFVKIDNSEKEARRKVLIESNMLFQVNYYYANLIKNAEATDKKQLLNIVVPPVAKKPFTGCFDPYGNTKYRQGDKIYLQHKYKQTLLVHINNACFCRCQFCYKVNEVNNDKSFFYKQIVDDSVEYIKKHPAINNILLTGGDPLVLPNKAFAYILKEFCKLPQIRGIRIATKSISFNPHRFFDDDLLTMLSNCNTQGKHISIVAQISHPAEFTPTMVEAVRKIQLTGASIRSQPVLARGINDDVNTLTRLFQKIYDNRIIPYYLVLFMPVRGVEQYAIPIDEAYKTVSRVSNELSGLEKKSIFITANDFGKYEICGFLPSVDQPEEIILKWHQIANEKYLPKAFAKKVPIKPLSLLKFKYTKEKIYNIDDILKYNQIPTEGDK